MSRARDLAALVTPNLLNQDDTRSQVGLGTTDIGAIVFNTTTNKHQGYDGSSWNDLY